MLTTGVAIGYAIHLIISGFHRFAKFSFNGILPFILVLLLGVLRAEMDKPGNQMNHILNEKIASKDFLVKLNNYPLERDAYYMYESLIMGYMKNDSVKELTGKVNLYIRKDSLLTSRLNYGDVLTISKSPFRIAAPKNPHEFNYQRYMSYQQVYHQVFLSEPDFQVIDNEPENTLLAVSYGLRSYFKHELAHYIPQEESRAIAYALILGIKDEITNDLKRAYSAAGAMHVLAVSGLHVGIIFMLISQIFSFLRRWRYGRFLLLFLNLFFLWSYAFVTGLSPSVLRAVVMFSVIIIGKESSRYANIYNSLAISALIILLYDPYMITRVGFQLSYLAVIGIVYLQPRLYGLFAVRNYLLDKAWAITCVSIAAQLATFPLGLYYFHQFPTYFLVSNLVVIPMAFGILLAGILLIATSTISWLGTIFGWLLDKAIWLLNQVVLFINGLDYSLIDWIYFDTYQIIIIYLFFLITILIFHFRNSKYVKYSYALFILLMGYSAFLRFEAAEKRTIVFYELQDNAAIDLTNGNHTYLHVANPDDDPELLQFQIGPNRLANFQPPVAAETFNDISKEVIPGLELLVWYNQRLLVISDQLESFNLSEPVEVDYLVISFESVDRLSKLPHNLKFKELIIDSTNSRKYGRKMEYQAKELGIVYHLIQRDGALVVNI